MAIVQLIGESCRDVYVYGSCPRLSPEAPVPVFIERERHVVPGMAGNVMMNLKALGVDCVLFTQDPDIVKLRFVEETRNHPLLRVDNDGRDIVPFDWVMDKTMPVAVADYNKGFIRTEDLALPKPKPSFIDTKRPLGAWAETFDFIKINEHEFRANLPFIEANRACMEEKLIVTLGGHGAMYKGEHFPISEARVFDVTGAGDTFFAAFIAKYLKTQDAKQAIIFANECARTVVMERGTSVVSSELALRV